MSDKNLKDKARQAYRDQQTQDTEGGCGEPNNSLEKICHSISA